MPTTIVNLLAQRLGMDPAEADRALAEFVQHVRQEAAQTGQVQMPGLGTFRNLPTGLVFQPDPVLSMAVNHRFEGLEPLTVNLAESTQSYRKNEVFSPGESGARTTLAPPVAAPTLEEPPAPEPPAVQRPEPAATPLPEEELGEPHYTEPEVEPDAAPAEPPPTAAWPIEPEEPQTETETPVWAYEEQPPPPSVEEPVFPDEPTAPEETPAFQTRQPYEEPQPYEEAQAFDEGRSFEEAGTFGEAQTYEETQASDEATFDEAPAYEASAYEEEYAETPYEDEAAEPEPVAGQDEEVDTFFDDWTEEDFQEAGVPGFATTADPRLRPNYESPVVDAAAEGAEEAEEAYEDDIWAASAAGAYPDAETSSIGSGSGVVAPPAEDRPPAAPERKRSPLSYALLALLLLGAGGVLGYYLLTGSGTTQEPDAPAVVENTPPAALPSDTAATLTTPVDSAAVAAATPEPEPPAPEPEPASPLHGTAIRPEAGGLTLIVASEVNRTRAEAVAQRFRSQGYNAAVFHGAYGGVTRYRIGVGQFLNEDQAETQRQNLPAGFPPDAWLMPIRPDMEIIQ